MQIKKQIGALITVRRPVGVMTTEQRADPARNGKGLTQKFGAGQGNADADDQVSNFSK